MNIVIGKQQRDLFTKGHIYDCVIRDSGQLQIYYKIYSDEFDLSCTKDEFDENFILIDKKKWFVRGDFKAWCLEEILK